MWTLANNPRVPDHIRNEVARWGTCKDEFDRETVGPGNCMCARPGAWLVIM